MKTAPDPVGSGAVVCYHHFFSLPGRSFSSLCR